MPKNYRNILPLISEEVLDFFMKSELFHEVELPKYFDFDEVLVFVRESIRDKKYNDCPTDIRTIEECYSYNII